MGVLKEIVFESETPSALARFWAQVLDGYAVRAYDEAEIARLARLGLTPETDPSVMVDGPGPSLCFHHVAARDYQNNRVHLDVVVADRGAEMMRLVALGAQAQRQAERYIVMTDPEGNQFCLVGV
jgi:hypothetical protein